MLNRLRKRIGSLISGGDDSAAGSEESAGGITTATETQLESTPETANTEELERFAREEAKKRERRLILSERIHNQATTILSELRNRLVYRVQDELEPAGLSPQLGALLERILSGSFSAELDKLIADFVDQLHEKLSEDFKHEDSAADLFPNKDKVQDELRTYRDELLRKHLLEQVEVLALPTLSHVFPQGGKAEAMKEGIASYWESCRLALTKFVDSEDMKRLTEAREGLQLGAPELLERLVTAQYRNGYRMLNDRFRSLYSKIIDLQMKSDYDEQTRKATDRQIVDDIVLPLAFFIRSRKEPEPREALRERAELFRDVVDKLVAVPESFDLTAEALKPVIRRSVQQARPLAIQAFPYLRSSLVSLVPAEVHRTTALLKLFECLVKPHLDEANLTEIEQILRTNRAQYNLFIYLRRAYPQLLSTFEPFERYQDDDADTFATLIEQALPNPEMIRDLAIRLRYLKPAKEIPDEPKAILRGIARILATQNEMTGWNFLYDDSEPSEEHRKLLSRHVHRRLKPTAIGVDDQQTRIAAIPLPVDLNKVLGEIGYRFESRDRSHRLGRDLEAWINEGSTESLSHALRWLRALIDGVSQERASQGSLLLDADPYGVEIWMNEARELVGLIQFQRTGYGATPVEMMLRKVETDENTLKKELSRQLLSRAFIYHTFFSVFDRKSELPLERRRELPRYLKTTYEPAELNRGLLKARCRNSIDVLERIGGFGSLILEAEPDAGKRIDALNQVGAGLTKKLDETLSSLETAQSTTTLQKCLADYHRILRYINIAILHSVNPWLDQQTASLSMEVEFNREDVERAVRESTTALGIDWNHDVQGLEAHPVRGTLGCRALLKLADGSSKVVILEYGRADGRWVVAHVGPRITDVVRDVLRQKGKKLPEDYDQKFENHSFGLDQQSCRFMLSKSDYLRVEATLLLRTDTLDRPWEVVYLKHNDLVLVDDAAG